MSETSPSPQSTTRPTPKTIALTGATGFVGRHVLQQLLERGHRVRALIRPGTKRQEQVLDSRAVAVQGDMFDTRALEELVTGADVVMHIVGIIMETPRQGQTFARVHVEAPKNLLTAAKRAGVKRWIHMSALGSRPDAVSNYHKTKWQAEELVRASGITWTIFRPSIIHGPDGEFMKMVKDFWCKLMPPIVPYFGSGMFGLGGAGKLQPVWVDDVAACFAEAVSRPGTEGETYPLGGPDPFTWPQLYATCKKYLPGAFNKPIVAIPVWKARLIAMSPIAPFNLDQVIMSQEDSTCSTAKVENDFDLKLAKFEEKLAEYAGRIP